MCRFASQLSGLLQNHLRAAVVLFYFSANLNGFTRKLAHVTQVLEIVTEHNHRKRTMLIVSAKIQVPDTPASNLDLQNFPADALRLADVFRCLIERNAGCRRKGREQQRDSSQLGEHTQILVGYRESAAQFDGKMCVVSQNRT